MTLHSQASAPFDDRVAFDHVHPPRAPLPAHACDCHVHVFDPARFPYVPDRTYTPAAATVADLEAFENVVGIERMVLVQPSGYGTDNRCLVEALGRVGQGRARGVAVVDLQRATPADIGALHAAGVRSIRLNLEVQGDNGTDRVQAAIARALQVVAAARWSIQIHADLDVIEALSGTIGQARTPVVLDHFGGLKAGKGPAQPAFEQLLFLLRNGHVYVKLSAPYRASKLPDYADLAPFVRKLIDAAPDRLVWASDWPHTGNSGQRGGDLGKIEPFRNIDDGAVLDLLRSWAPDEAIRHKILVDNPQRLYDF